MSTSITDPVQLRAFFSPCHGEYHLYALGQDAAGKRVVYTATITATHHEHGAEFGGPLVSMSEASALGLMDSLWNAGIRPSDMKSTSQIAAMETHLKDLRTSIQWGQDTIGKLIARPDQP